MRYDAVLFDMDGTVLDTLEDLHDGVNAALTAFSLPIISLEETRRFVGNGAKRLIDSALPTGTDEITGEKVLAYFKSYYAEHCQIKTGPYPDICKTMERLKAMGIKLAVVSNKPDEAVKTLAETFFPSLLLCAIGESTGVRRKPAPDTVITAAAQMGAELSGCVYVGDSDVDIATARNVPMPCISVAWGFRSVEELKAAGATQIVYLPKELIDIIEEK